MQTFLTTDEIRLLLCALDCYDDPYTDVEKTCNDLWDKLHMMLLQLVNQSGENK